MPIEYHPQDFFSSREMAASVFRRRQARSVVPHFHAFEELVFALAGGGLHVVDGKALEFCAGDVLLVRAGSSHHYRQARGFHLVAVLLRSELLTASAHAACEACFGRARAAPFHLRPAAAVFRQMLRWTRAIEARRWPECEPELAALLHAAAVSREVSPATGPTRLFGEGAAARLDRALRHLERNFAEPSPLEPLCDLSHMSPRTLLRRFHEVTGRTPAGYVGDLRLHHAMLALRRTERSILDVALDAGFPDLSYFYRRFRSSTGLAPRAWRKNPAHVW